MMEKNKRLDPSPLVRLLIDKSKAGKLNWEPTADRQKFVTSVGGNISFRIKEVTVHDYDELGQSENADLPILDMLDQKGNLIWQIKSGDVPINMLRELFDIARRIGNQVDDYMAGAIHALDKL